jgi:hypothetical protein
MVHDTLHHTAASFCTLHAAASGELDLELQVNISCPVDFPLLHSTIELGRIPRCACPDSGKHQHFPLPITGNKTNRGPWTYIFPLLKHATMRHHTATRGRTPTSCYLSAVIFTAQLQYVSVRALNSGDAFLWFSKLAHGYISDVRSSTHVSTCYVDLD